ncbi:hypothetical protein LCGC14_0305630 [marine sediment metagenome]|uniref:Uncharacterized protein n=1 Tax=marine sediment metagenome TaxID=412755 RepID=A0A0F9TTR3_9ZZZZ
MSLPKYMQPDSVKKTANKKEAKVFKHLVSGALNFKGDFSTSDTLIDNKSTKYKSIRVTEEMLQKIIDDSLAMGKRNSVIILDLPNYYVVGRIVKK